MTNLTNEQKARLRPLAEEAEAKKSRYHHLAATNIPKDPLEFRMLGHVVKEAFDEWMAAERAFISAFNEVRNETRNP